MGDEKDKYIFKLPLPLNDDGTWDMAQILGRVSVTFIVELDGDLAKRLAMQTGNFKLLSQWPNERRLQYLAPILWQQMERDLDKWQRSKSEKNRPDRYKNDAPGIDRSRPRKKKRP